MKTILIPTDFSNTSRNAVLYAFGLAKQVGVNKIVLYHAYSTPLNLTPDPVMSNLGTVDFELLKESEEEGLRYFKSQLIEDCPQGITIDLVSDYGIFVDGINTICKETAADLIVMGITGGGALTETLIGSNTTIVAKHSPVPVVIVPSDARYKHISRLLLVSDFDEVEESTPFLPIKTILNETGAQLYILHIAESSHHSLYEGAYESFAFKELFGTYNPEFHFEINPHFSDAINQFVEERKIDMTIIIPKKHSLWESLFVKSHTKELAFHTIVPLLAIHE